MDDELLSFDDLFGSSEETEKAEKQKKEKKATKKTEKIVKPKEEKTDAWTYPFSIHYAGHMLDVTEMFEDGQSYSSQQITEILLAHRYYEFSGDVEFVYIEADNVLVPSFRQHKKG